MSPHIKHSMAGPVHTISIEDMQHDYFRISPDSSTSFEISLTVNPTPLYRVEMSEDPSANIEIQIFEAFTSGPALATCRTSPKDPESTKLKFSNMKNIKNIKNITRIAKSPPVASVCTASPESPDAKWQALYKSSALTWSYFSGRIPLVMVPGCGPVLRNFVWRIGQASNQAQLELWLKEELDDETATEGSSNPEGSNRAHLFARYYGHGQKQGHAKPFIKKHILEVRRGGGIEFEFAVILEVLAILHLIKGK
jgi:hypothetical protein